MRLLSLHQDLGVADAPDDLKYNFGEQMLKGLFAGWLTARGLRSSEAPPGEPTQSFEGVQVQPPPPSRTLLDPLTLCGDAAVEPVPC